jgi:hypothetical protein
VSDIQWYESMAACREAATDGGITMAYVFAPG